MNQKEELEKSFYLMPIHSDLLEYWKVNKEVEPVKKALRFLFLSNFTFLGGGEQMRTRADNVKKDFYKHLDSTFDIISDINFSNFDFSLFLSKIEFGNLNDTFIYCDPPYLNTNDNYSNSFAEADHIRLYDSLEQTKCKFAISEFNNPFVIEQAEERNLNVIIIGERQNLKNRRTEILITNYKNNPTLFDDL